MANVNRTPGVYIEENNGFPNSFVQAPTAVPAFIGYTEKAVRDEKPLHLKPTKISSYAAYLQFFGAGPQTKFTVAASDLPGIPYQLSISESYFTLHSQMKMFFANGGADCYIVSVGGYTKEDGTANRVEVGELKKGIPPLLQEMEPTMLLIPELTTIPLDRDGEGNTSDEDVKNLYGLYHEMLDHCGTVMRNRIAILDVRMDREKFQDDDYNMSQDIDLFRDSVNSPARSWGAAYFPWLHTTAVSASEVGLLNVANLGAAEEISEFPEGTFDETGAIVNREDFKTKFLAAKVTSLASLLDKSLNQDIFDGQTPSKNATAIKEVLSKIPNANAETAGELTQSLLAVSPLFKALSKDMLAELNLLPPSAAMAGIYYQVDNNQGVYHAPANIAVGSVIKPAVNISDKQQEDLNVPIYGKAVNAIRSFHGKGVLVWGARTLDGNSQDWRYINVRRTVVFIEQSIKYALESFIFEPNTASTWGNVKALISNFLTNTWQSGALAGASPGDAFSVEVGLGSTMTPNDILDGYMRVSVKVAVTRPAEFIVITFQQQMQQS